MACVAVGIKQPGYDGFSLKIDNEIGLDAVRLSLNARHRLNSSSFDDQFYAFIKVIGFGDIDNSTVFQFNESGVIWFVINYEMDIRWAFHVIPSQRIMSIVCHLFYPHLILLGGKP